MGYFVIYIFLQGKTLPNPFPNYWEASIVVDRLTTPYNRGEFSWDYLDIGCEYDPVRDIYIPKATRDMFLIVEG